MPSTLSTSFSETSSATAIIVPSKPKALTISYKQLTRDVLEFQSKLAELGIGHGDAVSIALPNTYEFIVSFLATSYQRAIAAPLNPAYKQAEFSQEIWSCYCRMLSGWRHANSGCKREGRALPETDSTGVSSATRGRCFGAAYEWNYWKA